MKIAVVGAGAIGGMIGTRIAASGRPVSAVARGATAQALRTHGWRLESGGAMMTAPAPVAEDAAELGAQDLVIVAVKGPALAGATDAVHALLGPDTVVMTAMNGVPWWFFHSFGGALEGRSLESIDPGGRIAAAIPAKHIVGAVVHAACATPEPGLTRNSIGKRLIVGEPTGNDSPRVEQLVGLLRAAGFDVELSRRIQRDVWFKLWGNMTMNPVTALTGATIDRVLDDPLANAFCHAVMLEAQAIGARIGCPIDETPEQRNVLTRKLVGVKTSMLQDVEARRAVEIDTLLSAPREIGAALDMPTPFMDALLGLARLQAKTLGLYPS
jgi:2-dehydropantoate 2-reductase